MLTARRTPAASYITILARTTAMATAAESMPATRPAAVARRVTRAEWELGIPPDDTRRLSLSCRYRNNSKIVFDSCAIAHAAKAAIKIRLSKMVFIMLALFFLSLFGFKGNHHRCTFIINT